MLTFIKTINQHVKLGVFTEIDYIMSIIDNNKKNFGI